MTPRARARLTAIIVILCGLGLALGFALYGLSGKITYFQTPTDIATGALTSQQLERSIRVGGLVKTGTLKQSGETFTFTLTDGPNDLDVSYKGVLPDLFREGQGIVAHGHYDAGTKLFTADEVLAKHDENYMPPDVKKGLEDAHKQGLQTLMESDGN
ncbi:MAG: cytochrome c maturation protein CcmE [Alphaproteobacteria bacterium]|nr:cytochrome c maturation protein CcmE [Alphaproteobacteria bacterium]